jgi:hypothetical protein
VECSPANRGAGRGKQDCSTRKGWLIHHCVMAGTKRNWSKIPPGLERVPTALEIDGFTGMHCGRQYRVALRDCWRCPCCDRTAQECIRWAYISGPHWRGRFGDKNGEAWTIGLHEHHDHGWPPRFGPTVICCDCNSADSTAKRRCKIPNNWSFSPDEIRQFVKCAPHRGGSEIDYERAFSIYRAHMNAAPVAGCSRTGSIL